MAAARERQQEVQGDVGGNDPRDVIQDVFDEPPQRNVRTGKTTFGEGIESHMDVIRKAAREKDILTKRIQQFLRGSEADEDNCRVLSRKLLVLHINSYCKDGDSSNLLPAEFSLGIFTILDGLVLCVSGLINPGSVPIGMRADAKEMSDLLGLPMLGRHDISGAVSYSADEVLEIIMGMCLEHEMPLHDQLCFFTQRDCIPETQRCLDWLLQNQANKDPVELPYRLIPLSMLCVELSILLADALYVDDKCFVMTEGSAEGIINHPKFMYCPELGCDWHLKKENCDSVQHCSKNFVQRWIFNILAYFCYFCGIEKSPPTHAPCLLDKDVVDRTLMQRFEEESEREKINGSYGIVEDEEEDCRIIDQEY